MTDPNQLSDPELRGLAATKFHGGFGPWAKGEAKSVRDDLAAKGLISSYMPGITPEGDAVLKLVYIRCMCKTADEWSPFEQEYMLADARSRKRETDALLAGDVVIPPGAPIH